MADGITEGPATWLAAGPVMCDKQLLFTAAIPPDDVLG